MAAAIPHSPSPLAASPEKATVRAWVVCLTAALFFFYEFIQMNMFDAISKELMFAFKINAGQLGIMSSYYFIANVIFLFVAGALLDRYSTKKIILLSLAICILGTALFSFMTSFVWATVCRFLTGIGSAFCFLSCIRLASRWFPPHRMALITGFIVTLAMAGGMVAQAPLSWLVEQLQWRHALLVDAAFGGFIFFVILLVVKDYPSATIASEQSQLEERLYQLGYWQSLRLAFFRGQNWLAALYTCFMNLPLIVLGGLWGALYLMDAHHIAKASATNAVSMLFVGTIIGAPVMGWFSDKIKRRRLPMLAGSVIALIFLLLVIYLHPLSLSMLMILFFLIGFITSTQVIPYAYVAENSPRMITAMSVSVVNITTQGGIAFFQPLFGYLMDLHAGGAHSGWGAYQASDFTWAMLLFPAGVIISFIVAFLLRETYCQSIEESADVDG